jgi:hypothetical protein
MTGTGVTAFSLAAAPNLATVVVGTNTTSFTLSAASPFAYGQTIALACDSGAEIHCAFEPASIKPGNSSVLTVGDLSSTAPSSLSFHVSGTSGSQLATVPLTVRIADYSISTAASTAAVSAGQSATFTLDVRAVNGFNQPVSIDCSGVPPLATCQALPATVTPSDGNSAKVTIKVATTAPAVTSPNGNGPRTLPRIPALGWTWAALVMVIGFGLLDQRKSTSLRERLVAGSAELFVAVLLSGCGGGGQAPVVHHPGTPAGGYELTISATSGQLVRTVALTIQVN